MTRFVLSDTHFDHGNIIRYCNRPFDSAREMDETMIANWNRRVSPNDTVLFGGDLAMSSLGTVVDLADRLNGTIVLLRGNHDSFDADDVPFAVTESLYFTHEYEGTTYEFYYSHFPAEYQERTTRDDSRDEPSYAEPPAWFDGWNIHGHVHNNDLVEFPFVNHVEKTVNVGVDVLGFTPMRVDELVEILRHGAWYETVHAVPDSVYSV